jgi:hypothetical protein
MKVNHKNNSTKTLEPSNKTPVIQSNPITKDTVSNNREKDVKHEQREPGERTDQWIPRTSTQSQPTDSRPEPESRSQHLLPKASNIDENSTQLSSDSSIKPPSFDGKSIASGTTFALDEKESLRPDDSASLRAVEEEDNVSPPGSNAAGSRMGSELGMNRAFRDQLQEIAIMGPIPPRGSPGGAPGRYSQAPIQIANGSFPPSNVDALRTVPVAIASVDGAPVSQADPPPDDKLLEALASGRDRVWVLKLEQDLIDFVKDTKETMYTVPNCNSFYRMLAHRLADYFLLGHVVDNTNTKVQIYKTPASRQPLPLSSVTSSTSAVNTPPLDLPARKIMRRGDESMAASGTSTTTNSEGPSKAASEAGGTNSDIGLDAKAKANMTREEREAKYKEVRQRIFGDVEGNEGKGESEISSEAKDQSRSSSVAEKKTKKKQRSVNDEFEPRSQYNAYQHPVYGTPAYSPDNTNSFMIMPFPNVMMGPPQFPNMPAMPAPMQYANGFMPMMNPEAPQYGWPAPNFQSNSPHMGYAGPYQMPLDQQQLSEDFNRGLKSFQSTPTMTAQIPKPTAMGTPPMNAHMDQARPQSQPVGHVWSPVHYPTGFQQMQHQTVPPQYGPTGSTPPSSYVASTTPYPFGQLPAPTFANGKANKNQHPIPGSYTGNFNRQFNAQTPAFVPNRQQFYPQPPMQGPPMATPNTPYSGYPNTPQNHMPVQRASPPSSQPSNFNNQFNSQNSPTAMKTNIPSSHPPLPPPAAGANLPTNPMASAQPVSQSSIAKWGVPDSLPPKPPPPVSMQPPKFPLSSHGLAPGARPQNHMSPPVGGPSTVSSHHNHMGGEDEEKQSADAANP